MAYDPQAELPCIDLADLLQQPVDQAAYHSGKRTGYRDGWIDCVEAIRDTIPLALYTQLWDFWRGSLLQWKADLSVPFPARELAALGQAAKRRRNVLRKQQDEEETP